MQQIPVPKTLDVEVVERHLAALWQETAEQGDDDAAVLRARVANLMVFVSNESLLEETNGLMLDVTSMHPSRVLIMLGERKTPDQDIEMHVKALCQTEKRSGSKRLCGEVVVLKAKGKFTVELPSAALPLLVSDLTTFLWWRHEFSLKDKVFEALLDASDRLIIDSDAFASPLRDLREVNALFEGDTFNDLGVSDLNWARLTLWRGLLADFYDVPNCRPLLGKVARVKIDYTAPAGSSVAVAPQALLLTGWLSSCLGWKPISHEREIVNDNRHVLRFSHGASHHNSEVEVELNRVEIGDRKPGRLVQVQLHTNDREKAFFSVERSEDNRHILSEASIGANTHRGRVLPVRNRSLAQLLSREMEILINDNLYQQALSAAVDLLGPAN